MKSIRLTGATRKYLKDYNNLSFDRIIDGLIDETEERMPRVVFDGAGATPIKISDDTYDRLMGLAISDTETVDSIVMRMLLLVDGVDYED